MSADAPDQKKRLSTAKMALFAMPFIIFVALGAVLAFKTLSGPQKRQGAVFATAPELDLPLLGADGRLDNTTLASTDGPVVVNFWASWCVPCQVEHPQLMTLAQSGEVSLVGVAYQDQPQNAGAFLAGNGNPFSIVGLDSEGVAAVSWGVRGVPETFVLTADGAIVYKHTGPILPHEYEEKILPAIEQAKAR